MIKKLKVNQALNNYIKQYWVQQSDFLNEKLLPDGSIHLIINLGDPVCLDNGYETKRISDFCIVGPHQHAITLYNEQNTYLVGVNFKLGKFFNFFDSPAYQYTNQIFKPNTPIRKQIINLQAFIECDDQLISVKSYLDRFFIKNLHEPKHHKIFEEALEILQTNSESMLIKEICKELGVSNKHLIKMFKDRVGLLPKSVHRINKFQKVITEINNNPNIDWSELVYNCNYFDQAHLINEFKNFCGITPAKYLKNKVLGDLRIN